VRARERAIGAVAGIAVVLAAVATLGVATVGLGDGGSDASVATARSAPLAPRAEQTTGATAETGAAAQADVDCCRSQITQDLVDRNPLPGGGFEIVIEATLDSNAVCHVLLL